VEPQQPNISYFLSLATSHTVWVHEVVDMRSESPTVGLLRILVGPQPPVWRENETWTYRNYVFAAKSLPLREVREWFEDCAPDRWAERMGVPGELRLVPNVDGNLNRTGFSGDPVVWFPHATRA